MTPAVRLTILCEDQARMGFLDKKFFGQHGLAIFVEADCRVLFDTGPSAVILANAAMAGVNLASAEWIVLSHGHWDHTDGLEALMATGLRTRLLVHPDVFARRHRPSGEFNGMLFPREQLASAFELHESTGPLQLSDTVWFLGEIPRTNDFEAQTTPFFRTDNGPKRPDPLPDDTALAIRTPRGLVVVTGCSHAGVCNICEHARKVTGEERLHMVLGGFHLLDDSDIVDKSIAYFRERQVERLLPMHCTAMPALAKFHTALGIEKASAGDVVEVA